MPETPTLVTIAVELVILFAGCLLLWRHVFSPAARQQPCVLATWDLKAGDFLLFIWLVVCGGLLVQVAAVPLLKLAQLESTANLILAGAAFHAGMLLGYGVFHRLRKAVAAAPSARRPVVTAGFATFVIALPVITAASFAWQFLLSLLGIDAQPQDLVELFADAKSVPLLVLMIAVATLLAPITEELVFRAGFFRYCRGRMPRWAALVLPSVLFAGLHTNLASFVPLALLGVVFSLAYERTGSIAVPIIAHALFNLNTIILILSGVGP
ncbi:MAG: CPBP family intramembrane metalloprotease [Opitutaceae bacterium]|nr:CPBP family intramembrane metalloprotease [Opitutaceae bacterium]